MKVVKDWLPTSKFPNTVSLILARARGHGTRSETRTETSSAQGTRPAKGSYARCRRAAIIRTCHVFLLVVGHRPTPADPVSPAVYVCRLHHREPSFSPPLLISCRERATYHQRNHRWLRVRTSSIQPVPRRPRASSARTMQRLSSCVHARIFHCGEYARCLNRLDLEWWAVVYRSVSLFLFFSACVVSRFTLSVYVTGTRRARRGMSLPLSFPDGSSQIGERILLRSRICLFSESLFFDNHTINIVIFLDFPSRK